MKLNKKYWWFTYNSTFTKCYQFKGNKLMWIVDLER